MIEVAQDTLKKQPVSTGQYEYVQASAESLPFLEDGSVDLVIAGACVRNRNSIILFVYDTCVVAAQAGHWFDWNKMWPELARVLRKNGSAAFWVCISDPSLVQSFLTFA